LVALNKRKQFIIGEIRCCRVCIADYRNATAVPCRPNCRYFCKLTPYVKSVEYEP